MKLVWNQKKSDEISVSPFQAVKDVFGWFADNNTPLTLLRLSLAIVLIIIITIPYFIIYPFLLLDAVVIKIDNNEVNIVEDYY